MTSPAEDLTALSEQEIRGRVEGVRDMMRPLEQQLASLRADREWLLTEVRRRERASARQARSTVKAAMKEGQLPTVADLVETAEAGSFDDYVYNLKTGGQVRLGFPGARVQTIAFTDGRQTAQARDLAEAASLFRAGWELGGAGRPGVRIHFLGTRQERLMDASEVFARPVERAPEDGARTRIR